MGNRAILTIRDQFTESRCHIYVHWFDENRLRDHVRAALRKICRDCLAAGIIAEYVSADIRSGKRRAKAWGHKWQACQQTTIRIIDNPEPWLSGLDVPGPIVITPAAYATVRVEYPNGQSETIEPAKRRRTRAN